MVITTFKDFLLALLESSLDNSYEYGWPGSYWIRISFLMQENTLETKIINKFFKEDLLEMEIHKCLPQIVNYKKLVEAKGTILEPIMRVLKYIIPEVKKYCV